MKIKIVSDSASNLETLSEVAFESVPLRITTDAKEYVDNSDLDIEAMVEELAHYKGRSQTACPGVGDWLAAFEDYDVIYCVTIISVLSGSYNSAMAAKKLYEEEHPDRHVFVLDSFSAGAEMKLHLYKLKQLVQEGKDFETISGEIQEYKNKHTALIFCLESLRNLANNGRINPAVAKLCSIIGIRVVGDVNEEGLHPTDKCRGEKKATKAILENLKRMGYHGGTILIDHCYNEAGSMRLKENILEEFPTAHVVIEKTRGLCSFYAEKGGLMIGFER